MNDRLKSSQKLKTKRANSNQPRRNPLTAQECLILRFQTKIGRSLKSRVTLRASLRLKRVTQREQQAQKHRVIPKNRTCLILRTRLLKFCLYHDAVFFFAEIPNLKQRIYPRQRVTNSHPPLSTPKLILESIR